MQQSNAKPNLLKFHPGEFARNLIQRPRLQEQVIRSQDAKAIFLHAPAGYGKTALMTDLFNTARQNGEHAAWLNCDITDQAPEIFIKSLVSSLETCGLKVIDERGNLGELLHILDQHPTALKIFIDEYESVSETLIDEILNQLILVLPSHVQLLIGTRKAPARHFSRLQVEGVILSIDANALRFTDTEAKALLGTSFNQTELDTIINFAEGWPLVLQLAGIKHQTLSDKQTIIDILQNPTSDAFSYLAEQVFSTLSSGQQHFLEQCSILTFITAEAANVLTDEDDTFTTLSSLLDLQPIVTVTSTTPTIIKLHPLFREFLQQQLQHRGDEYLRSLHTKAALYYMKNNAIDSAITQAQQAKDPVLIAMIIETCGGLRFVIEQGTAATRSLLKEIPQPLINENVVLCAVQTVVYATEGNGQATQDQYNKFLALIADSEADNTNKGHIHYMKLLLGILLPCLQDLTRSISHDISENHDKLEKEVRRFSGADPRDLCLIAAPRFLLLQRYGDVEQARRYLQEYETVSDTHGYARNLTPISPHLGLIAYNAGDFDMAIHHFSGTLSHHWDRFNQRERLMSQIGNAMLARIYYERNELDLSLANVEAIGNAPEHTIIEIAEAKSVTLARGRLGQGKLEHALNHLRESARRAEVYELHNMTTIINTALACALMGAGQNEESTQIVEQHKLVNVFNQEIKPTHTLWFLQEHLLRVLVPYLIHRGQIAEARKISDAFSNRAAAQGRQYMLALGLIFQTKAALAEGKVDEAQALLVKAIVITTDIAITRPYLDAGADIILLLENIIGSLDDEKQINHAQQLKTLWDSQLKFGKTAEILTKREQDVLAGLARGHPTKVIARDLGLAPETVKYHLKHIFAKLGVGNRKEAVTEAWKKAMFS